MGIEVVFGSIGVSEISKRSTSSRYMETSSATGSEGDWARLTTGSSRVTDGRKLSCLGELSCLGGWGWATTDSWVWVI